ncbi:MAG: putative b-glycosidase, module, Glycoside Hydrolase Family 8 protein, partial [Bacteroidota bacterium]
DTPGSISGPTTVCQAQNAVTYTIPAINLASSYQWTLPGGATGTSATNQITLDYAANAVSGALTVVGTNACGNGDAASAAVTVNPLPAAADTIDGTWVVCQQQNAVTYSIALVADANGYLWTLPNGATGTSTTNEIILDYGTNAVSGLLTVTPTNACGNGAAASAAVTVNPLPAAADTIDGTWVVCQQQNAVSYSIALVADASGYIWTLPNGATGTSTTNEIILDYGTNAVSGLLTVTPTNACGNGAAASAAVTVNPLPAAADTIDGTWVVCQQQNAVTYSIPLIANASGYVWTIPNGATGTSTTNSISVDFSDQAITGAITVTGTNGCGLGNSAVDTIVVVSLPIAFAGNDTTICEGALVSLTATGGNNYVWNNGVAQEVPFLPDTTQTYTVSVSNGTCQSTDSVTVTVSATPVTPTISATGQIFSSSAGYGNQWYNDLGIIAGANNQQYTPVTTGNYFVIVTDSVGCISDTSNSLYFTEVGITDLIRADLFTIYPNPAEHDVTIRVNGNQETTYKLSMINTLGEILYTGQITYANKTIDLTGYAPGIYTLVFELNDTYYSRKLILK